MFVCVCVAHVRARIMLLNHTVSHRQTKLHLHPVPLCLIMLSEVEADSSTAKLTQEHTHKVIHMHKLSCVEYSFGKHGEMITWFLLSFLM